MSVVHVNTRTYTATHVATNIALSLKQLIRGCGLDLDHLGGSWRLLEEGMAELLRGQHLLTAVLEVYDPTRRGAPLVGRFDFDIDYSYYADGDGDLWVDPDTVKATVKKNGSYPANCTYGIICTWVPGTPMPHGWQAAQLRSTNGLVKHSVGTMIGAGGVGTSLSYYRRSAS